MIGGGQIYLKIVEARNLPGINKDGTSDPIVNISLLGGKTKKTTECFRKTVSPVWNEEYLISSFKRNEKIILNVEDYVRIFRNKPLGNAELDLADVPDNTPLDMWIPIHDNAGELHVIVHFIPCPIEKPFFKKLPSFRLQLERSTYYPGEVIRGHIIYNVGNPVKIRGVRIKFTGYSKTHWTEQELRKHHHHHRIGNNHHHHQNNQYETVTYSSYHNFFCTDATLYGNQKGVKESFYINPGSYFLPFEFILPMGLAPSYKHQHGQISYNCRAYIDIPWGFDKTIDFPLNIAVEYGSLNIAKTIITQGTKGGLFSKSQNIRVAATTPDIAYVGEPVMIGLQIINEGTKAVNEIGVSIDVISTFVGEKAGSSGLTTKVAKTTITSAVLKNMENIPIHPGQVFNGNIELHIPENSPISILSEHCPNIQVRHQLVIQAVTAGNIFTKSKAGVVFNLLVGKRYPHLQHVVIPVQPPSTPNIVNVSQVEDSYKYFAPPIATSGSEEVFIGNVVPSSSFEQNRKQADQFAENAEKAINPEEAKRLALQEYSKNISEYGEDDQSQQPQFGQPQQPQYGQPQQPQYGQPQQPQYGQPQQPQYGQPQQPYYGQPQQPYYGQPQQPQYGQP